MNNESYFRVKHLKILRKQKFNAQHSVLGLLFFTSSVCYFFFISSQSTNVFHQQNSNKSNAGEITIDRGLYDYLAFHLRDTPYDGVANYTRFMITALGLKGLHGVEPLVAGMGLVINDITSFKYPLSISPCRQQDTAGNANSRSLLISIISAPDNFEKRQTIRRTWSNHLTNQTNIHRLLEIVGFGFVIGLTNNSLVQQKIEEESERYGDILKINVIDKYVKLSVKVAGLINWVSAYCQRVDFVLKVDDDVYVNVHNLATVLHSLPPSERSVYGHTAGGNHPSRTEGKWATSFENWPWYQFPTYFQGAGIVIAGSAVRSLLSAIQTTPYFIWDDMYLIGLCAVKAGLKIRTSNRIFFDVPENYADPCFVHFAVMWSTQSADWMRSSNKVCQNYYRNPRAAYCVVDNQIQLVNGPASASEFSFGFLDHN
ncbi:beta-1,3-galactosyltransferase 5-like [Daphnia pulicaria]|uniref:beta-1,3-galactosyltransferase 5-like n=1 Tax=Daphnia pulicaria TaxID=35523 RepID=UPI001EEACB04|nr:beta-1,3-galactosyltransferase 5-like [Daphnia pulicaria]